MKYSAIHYAAREAQERGEDVIVLSVGDPELETPTPVLDKAIESLRAHDVRYTPAAGRHSLRAAIAAAHTARTAQPVDALQVIFLSGAQNALFTASLCVAGAGVQRISHRPARLTGRRHRAHEGFVLRHTQQSKRCRDERGGACRHCRPGATARVVDSGG